MVICGCSVMLFALTSDKDGGDVGHLLQRIIVIFLLSMVALGGLLFFDFVLIPLMADVASRSSMQAPMAVGKPPVAHNDDDDDEDEGGSDCTGDNPII